MKEDHALKYHSDPVFAHGQRAVLSTNQVAKTMGRSRTTLEGWIERGQRLLHICAGGESLYISIVICLMYL